MKLKLRQKAVALLAVVCLLVSMVPMTGRAAGEVKSATLWVRCNQIPLDGSTITATLKGNGEDVLLGTSTNGELIISADSTEMEGKRIEVSILLPEGYGQQMGQVIPQQMELPSPHQRQESALPWLISE